MESSSPTKKVKAYMNPYLAGVLLGLVLLAANFISGRGLGASGAVKSVVVTSVVTVNPQAAESSDFIKDYEKGHTGNPMKNWLVFQMMGVILGAFVSGILSGRLGLKTEHGPQTTSKKRLIFAVAGGILFGFGSQLGRGCTSGSALSGLAVMSAGGILTMMAIFGTGYALAYFFRKNWI